MTDTNPLDRDRLGCRVREAWVRWAEQQPDAKPGWLASYDLMDERDKEADRQIGEQLAAYVQGVLGDHDQAALHALIAETQADVASMRAVLVENGRVCYACRINVIAMLSTERGAPLLALARAAVAFVGAREASAEATTDDAILAAITAETNARLALMKAVTTLPEPMRTALEGPTDAP